MSDFEAGWSAHPDAIDDQRSDSAASSFRVIGLGASCDLRMPSIDDGHTQSFSVSEFALLENGQRVILHEDRGFSIGSQTGAVRDYETSESITQSVLNAVLPDDDGCADEHPWSWLAELARARGLDVTAGDLRDLPYQVILTDAVTRWLTTS